MSLERFKTQILLLHKEQSTLDKLSSGFNDVYTVHCATSGSEALNTLGETDIDVIVTAQDLPGMSGIDALREAKKRSPETIGILLIDNEGEGVEAVVGDQEVFQIVRGGVTPESLRSVVDDATRQDRLDTLAHSANDTTAAVDEPAGEHIIMETSENGSAIITDATGRLPVLKLDEVSPEANVGSRAVDVLVLTKDEEFLVTVRESARGMHKIIYANTLAQADDAVRNQKVGVAVIDAAMVGDNVEKLTMHLRSAVPRLVSIVAGRRDDGEMLMELINRGKVYRFLLKPVSPGRARLAIEASVKHHLEAPDSAFRTIGSAAPLQTAPPIATPTPKKEPKASRKKEPKAAAPAAKPQAKPQQQASQPQASPEQSQTVPTIRVEPRPVPSDSASPIDAALDDAFGGDDKSFTETMTGIVRSVGAGISAVTARKNSAAPEPIAAITAPPQTGGADSGGSMFSNPKILGLGAAAIVAVLGAGWWFMSGSDDPALIEEPLPREPLITEAEPVYDVPAPGESRVVVDDLVEQARLAVEAGQVFNPPGSNAIELYLAAVAATPGDVAIAAELEAVIEQALGMAESSLLARRPEDAAAALQRVALADPGNSRLPFLTAQLAQIQLRDFLDSARLAIREGRYEDAAVALNGARAIATEDSSEIDLVADELSNALSEQRVEEVLAKANSRFDDGKLTAPSNDNARYYYELALSNDPNNTAARQGLTAVAGKLVLQARTEIDAGRFDVADNLLADARRLDPDSSELASATAALSTARDRQAQARRAAQQRAADEKAAAERAATERLAAEQAAAEQAAAEQAAAEQAAAEQAAAEQAAAEQAAAEQAAAEQAAAEQAAAELAAAEQAAADLAAVEQAAAEQAAAEQAAAEQAAAAPTGATLNDDSAANEISAARPVSLRSLARTKYVAPKYPRSAQRRNKSGWVDITFIVDIDGTVRDVSVEDSNPGIVFVDAAVTAVEAWEFEPVIENGIAVQKRSSVRMMFALE